MSEELTEYLGPYQDANFIDPEETIDLVNRYSPGGLTQMTNVYFKNGENITLIHGSLIGETFMEYREGLNILMNREFYSNNETQWSNLTNDRVLFYLAKVGSL